MEWPIGRPGNVDLEQADRFCAIRMETICPDNKGDASLRECMLTATGIEGMNDERAIVETERKAYETDA